MPKIEDILKKIELYKKFPDQVKPPTPEEIAVLASALLDRVAGIDTFNQDKAQDFTDQFDQTKKQLEASLKDLMGEKEASLSQLANSLENRVEAILAGIKVPENGKDAEITEEQLARIIKEASEMVEIPDVDPVVDERITANKEAVRDALELFTEEDDKLAIEAIGGLVSKLDELEKRISDSNGKPVGGVSVATVLRLISENGGGLPDQTGNNGKFLTTDGTDPSWESIPGGGDMLASTYDPTAVAGDAFDMDNMVEGTDTKILTAAERAAIAANTAKVSNATHTGDVTGDTALTIANDAVTFDKIQNIATNRVLARSSSGTGSVEDLTLPNFRSLINVADGATANDTDANLLNRANHTGTQTASTISDFDTEVANNSAVAANTAKVSYTDAAKVATIETNADVTDTTNVTAAGALMDSEVTNLAQVKAFDSTDYATAAQGTTADSALQPNTAISVDEVTYDSPKAAVSAIGNSGSSQTLNALTSTIFTTSLTANCAFTFSNLTAGKSIELHMYGDGTQRTPTFPTAKLLYNDTTIAYPTTTGELLVLTARHNGTEVVISAAGNYAAFA